MELIPIDSAELATAILGSNRLVSLHRRAIELYCDWREIRHDPKTALMQIGRAYTTSDFWENEKDDLLEEHPEIEAQVADLFEWVEQGLLSEEEALERFDVLTEPLLPTILDDWRMWLPRASCYTSALFVQDVARELMPDREWKLVVSEADLHAFVYSEETDEIFDMLLSELSGRHHTVAKVFDEADEYADYIYTQMHSEEAA